MSVHTPGPWFYSRGEAASEGHYVSAEEAIVAETEGYHPESGEALKLEVAESNARLIAAAPDLLEALIHLLIAGDDESRECAVFDAEKAIEKATGASSTCLKK